MEESNAMKKRISLFVAFILVLIIVGCTKTETPKSQSEPKILIGYIVIKDDKVCFDEVEIISREDEERIAELGLIEEADYPSGYCIINQEEKEEIFKLTDQTEYNFTDVELHFIADAEGNRRYTTTKKNEFLIHLGKLNDIPLSEQRIPYFIEVESGKVISITEKFEYTI